MAVEAIASVSNQNQLTRASDMAQAGGSIQQSGATSSPANGVDATVISQQPAQASSLGEPGFTVNLSSQVYGTIDRLGVELPAVKGTGNMAVDQAKKALLPENSTISPVKSAQNKPTGNESLVALSKTFDHAVFMAMMNQVISGVSDTSRTLIKQA